MGSGGNLLGKEGGNKKVGEVAGLKQNYEDCLGREILVESKQKDPKVY